MPVTKDVLIGLPCYDNRIDVDIYQEALTAVNDPECVVAGIQHYNGDSLIPRGRNKIAKMFLDTPHKYLMFIDSDIKFHRGMINKLRSHNKGIIGGIYLKKTLPYQPVMNSLISREGDLNVMREIGTGFMMIRRDVFGAIRTMWPEHTYKADSDEKEGYYYDYFQTGVFRLDGTKVDEPGRYLSEDYAFCQIAAQINIKTYLDPSILTQHIGRMAFPTEDKKLLEGAALLMENMIPNAPMEDSVFERIENAVKGQRAKRGVAVNDKSFNTVGKVESVQLPEPQEYIPTPAKGAII
jgi:hypothetical protein